MNNHTPSELLAYELLTTSTGTHMLDSGGTYGRHWQQNKIKTIEDFKNEPSATLEIYGAGDVITTVNIFHVLAGYELDDLCNEYNGMDCEDWNGEYYGVSVNQDDWLEQSGFVASGDGWNTYNWDNNFSQVLQGQTLHHEPTDTYYQLVQVHNGADVRGGYTDAKLYRVGDYEENATYALMDNCGFSVETSEGECLSIDWSGEWITDDGSSADDEYLEQFTKAAGYVEDSLTIEGEYYPSEY